jgi:hypothetical protein
VRPSVKKKSMKAKRSCFPEKGETRVESVQTGYLKVATTRPNETMVHLMEFRI